MNTKIIPFNSETAKKIQAREIEGKIVRNGHEVIILDYNSQKYPGYSIRIAYMDKDEIDYVAHERLHIEVPDNDGPQFKPFDKVLCRDDDNDVWKANLFSHEKQGMGYPYYVCGDSFYAQCIRFEGNEHLVGTNNKPKEE